MRHAFGAMLVLMLLASCGDTQVIVVTATPPFATATANPTLAAAATANAQAFAAQTAAAAPTATPLPAPTKTRTPEEWGTQFPLIGDARELAKNPDSYRGKQFSIIGEVFNIRESGGVGIVQLWVTERGQRIAVTGQYAGDLSRTYVGSYGLWYVVGQGTTTISNAYGGMVDQPFVEVRHASLSR